MSGFKFSEPDRHDAMVLAADDIGTALQGLNVREAAWVLGGCMGQIMNHSQPAGSEVCAEVQSTFARSFELYRQKYGHRRG